MSDVTQTGLDNVELRDTLLQGVADAAAEIDGRQTGIAFDSDSGQNINDIAELAVTAIRAIAVEAEDTQNINRNVFAMDVEVVVSKDLEDTMFIDLNSISEESLTITVDKLNSLLPEGATQAVILEETPENVQYTVQVPISAMSQIDFDAVFEQVAEGGTTTILQAQKEMNIDDPSLLFENATPAPEAKQPSEEELKELLDLLIGDDPASASTDSSPESTDIVVQHWDPVENGYAAAMTEADPECDACAMSTQFTASSSGEFTTVNENPTAPIVEDDVTLALNSDSNLTLKNAEMGA